MSGSDQSRLTDFGFVRWVYPSASTEQVTLHDTFFGTGGTGVTPQETTPSNDDNRGGSSGGVDGVRPSPTGPTPEGEGSDGEELVPDLPEGDNHSGAGSGKLEESFEDWADNSGAADSSGSSSRPYFLDGKWYDGG